MRKLKTSMKSLTNRMDHVGSRMCRMKNKVKALDHLVKNNEIFFKKEYINGTVGEFLRH